MERKKELKKKKKLKCMVLKDMLDTDIKMKQSKTTLSKTSYFCVKFVNDFQIWGVCFLPTN